MRSAPPVHVALRNRADSTRRYLLIPIRVGRSMDSTVGASAPLTRAKFRIGGAVIVLTVIALLVWALTQRGATSFYVTTGELAARGPTTLAEGYRVNGRVVGGSIERSGLETSFLVSDGSTELRVVTDRPLPDTFKDGSDVVVSGSYNGSSFTAVEVLAKCPSKFKAKT